MVVHVSDATVAAWQGRREQRPRTGPPVLRLEGVSRSFASGAQRVRAVDGLDLSVWPGELVTIVGRSGSGKSTVLHLAGGLARPDEGRVLLHERDLAELTPRQLAEVRRRLIGFVFQFFHLLPTLSVAENVGLPLILDGRAPRQATERAGELLEAVGLAHRARHLPGELSGGEMQRVAIARSLVAAPELILADEPTGNLDSVTGAEVLDVLVSRTRDSGAALVMVTHDRSIAGRADRSLTLVDGRMA